MSQRISECFLAAKEDGRKVLIPFITAGDPDPDWNVAVMHALIDAGADLIELGVPFSDPMADGTVIQLASERAIEKGVSLSKVLQMVELFRQTDNQTPVVLMGYMNPVEHFGRTRFPSRATDAGVDGLLLVDCPPEERGDLGVSMHEAGLDGICMIAPTTTRDRVREISKIASGFIYYVSLKGITGAGQLNSPELSEPVKQIREFSDLPVAVGFGIKNAEMAVKVAEHADAVVIGSALVEALAKAQSKEDACSIATAFVAPVRKSLDNTG
ncbi:MAG: tryptophan synthase subunit alpha [Xanthomonadales bacterium]|nr:tryptophan synthase subunit alpha [Xanthomonadales bacterium]